jgi:glucose-1-phosphate thymidylyltransferase
VPHTLDSAYRVLRGKVVALGFPDILFEPPDAFAGCLECLRAGNAPIVLGLFPTEQPEKTDMVELDQGGRPVGLVIKEPDRGLAFTWSIAVWRPEITELLHRWLDISDLGSVQAAREVFVGNFFQWLIDRGVAIDSVRFERGSYLDIGTPGDLEAARARYRASPHRSGSPGPQKA